MAKGCVVYLYINMHTYMNLPNPKTANSNGQQPWKKKTPSHYNIEKCKLKENIISVNIHKIVGGGAPAQQHLLIYSSLFIINHNRACQVLLSTPSPEMPSNNTVRTKLYSLDLFEFHVSLGFVRSYTGICTQSTVSLYIVCMLIQLVRKRNSVTKEISLRLLSEEILVTSQPMKCIVTYILLEKYLKAINYKFSRIE